MWWVWACVCLLGRVMSGTATTAIKPLTWGGGLIAVVSRGAVAMGKTWWLEARWPLRLHRHRPSRWMPMGRQQFFILIRKTQFVLTSLPNKGICVVAVGPRGEVYSPANSAFRHLEVPAMKKKNVAASSGGAKHLAPVESDIMAQLMPLVEHCCLTQYDDGDAREPGWLTIKTQGSAWVVQVKDPDSGTSFSSVAETLDKALETAALLLGTDEAPWTPDQWLMKNKKKK